MELLLRKAACVRNEREKFPLIQAGGEANQRTPAPRGTGVANYITIVKISSTSLRGRRPGRSAG
jgi:hypothetical protein